MRDLYPHRLPCGCVLNDTEIPPRRCKAARSFIQQRHEARQLAEGTADPDARKERWAEHHGWSVLIGSHLARPEAAELRRAA
jgi:hypothetical protein